MEAKSDLKDEWKVDHAKVEEFVNSHEKVAETMEVSSKDSANITETYNLLVEKMIERKASKEKSKPKPKGQGGGGGQGDAANEKKSCCCIC